jgi:hypothetical protein
MLERLVLRDVGPAPAMSLDFAERINIITGDNGLGKSFLLDVAWWALTRTWARRLVVPHPPPAKPRITFRYTKKTPGAYEYSSTFDRRRDTWSVKPAPPPIPGLVLYAQVDGGFSVWDPARNYWKKGAPERPAAYLFRPEEVWDGNDLCEGLVRDWASWQRENGEPYRALKSVLRALSPSDQELLTPGELRKITLDDPKRYPTLRMTYGQDVAVIHLSAGMQRILALAYLLVWAWYEHRAAVELSGSTPARDIIFLIDEIEAHLHPQWQRRIIPALLHVMNALTGDRTIPIQLITATHSPLVLASIEPHFDDRRDRVFVLELIEGNVGLRQEAWAKQGDVVNWLVSDVFGLRQGRSLEAERAIEAAEAWMRGDRASLPEGLQTKEAIHKELQRVLAGHDPFWPRWIVWVEKQEVGG